MNADYPKNPGGSEEDTCAVMRFYTVRASRPWRL